MRLHRRRGRIEAGRTILEGPIVVTEADAAGIPVETVFALDTDEVGRSLARSASAPLVLVTEEVLARLSTTSTPQSPVAVIEIPRPVHPTRGRILVAWGVADPGNCGTLIRSAAAFGYGYGAGPGTADTWSPKVIRAASGAHFRTTLGAYAAVSEVRSPGMSLFAAVPAGGAPPGPLPPDVVVLIGSESHGLPPEVRDHVDGLITIPMAEESESLNAGVAGSIIAFAGSQGDAPGRAAPGNVLPSQHS